MTGSTTQPNVQSKLARLMVYLDRDPQNLMLIADSASAALDEGDAVQAVALIERYAALEPLPPALINLQGLAAMAQGRFDDAAGAFESLMGDAGGDPTLRFNLAWARTMLEDYPATSSLIDAEVAAAVPAAAALKVEALHHQGMLEDALAAGMGFLETHPADHQLLGALAVVALDAEDHDLARAYATRAGPASDDGLATLGTLALGGQQLDEALGLFDQALAIAPHNARAQVGRGFALLGKGDAAAAAEHLAAGAAEFGDDTGSWIAAGWAQFTAGKTEMARESFEQALAIEPESADTEGSLAVLDVVGGDIDGAERRVEKALALDPNCYTATLAKSLIVSARGDQKGGEALREAALNTPVGPGGLTVARAMATGARPTKR